MILEPVQCKRIAEKLTTFLEQKALSSWYNAPVPESLNEICPDLYKKISKTDGNYEKNCLLKEKLPAEFKNLDDDKAANLAIWIIRKWGQINRKFQNDGPTMDLVKKFIAQTKKGEDDTILNKDLILSINVNCSITSPLFYFSFLCIFYICKLHYINCLLFFHISLSTSN